MIVCCGVGAAVIPPDEAIKSFIRAMLLVRVGGSQDRMDAAEDYMKEFAEE